MRWYTGPTLVDLLGVSIDDICSIGLVRLILLQINWNLPLVISHRHCDYLSLMSLAKAQALRSLVGYVAV
jgi:hypothetical protein